MQDWSQNDPGAAETTIIPLSRPTKTTHTPHSASAAAIISSDQRRQQLGDMTNGTFGSACIHRLETIGSFQATTQRIKSSAMTFVEADGSFQAKARVFYQRLWRGMINTIGRHRADKTRTIMGWREDEEELR